MRLVCNMLSIFFFGIAFLGLWIPADIERVQAMMLFAIFVNLIGKEFKNEYTNRE